MRFVRGLDDSAVMVLGNHDMEVLAAAGAAKVTQQDTVTECCTHLTASSSCPGCATPRRYTPMKCSATPGPCRFAALHPKGGRDFKVRCRNEPYPGTGLLRG